MRRTFSKLLMAGVIAGTLCTAPSYAFGADVSASEGAPGVGGVKDAEVSLGSGYRKDELNWNIAGNSDGSNPNILSELKWTGLEIFQVEAKARKDFGDTYLTGYFDWGWINDGKNQDSDYNGDDRTQEYSRSNNSGDDGTVWDISTGVGFNITAYKYTPFKFSPVFGYSYHRQNLTITNGYQTIPHTGPFSGLDSTYNARWYGPWAGADLAYKTDRLTLKGLFEYHLVEYYATANWNLRSDFAHPKSFEHTANGMGIIAELGADVSLGESWGAGFSLDAKRFTTGEGRDRTYFSDGSRSDTKLNEVNWNSYSAMLDLRYRF